jgi:protoporphyrinogen oxidase
MNTIILGGGLAGLSLAFYLNQKCLILEKEKRVGGLCRSYEFNSIMYDIGPHALFSKNKTILSKITSLTQTNKLRRSNKIYHKDRFVKYPFENDLASLDERERDYCLKEFLCNPYENYDAHNMLQFFLKTFGEGITKVYLQPYNEKIWKFDPAFMDLQMVERIPKPPKEDVIKSARGIETEGYTHQLYFHYPQEGGIQKLITELANRIAHKATMIHPVMIHTIAKKNKSWVLSTDKGSFTAETLINCMPLHELFKYIEAPPEVCHALSALKYNSIYIVVLQTKKDAIGDNFALYFSDQKTIFHRISKLNFLGNSYRLKNGGSTIMIEITYRPNSYLGGLPPENIRQMVLQDLDRLNLVKKDDILESVIQQFQYAYVIYDVTHRTNADLVLKHLTDIGIVSCGRFAEFEYLNMDATFEHSYALAQKINSESNGK